MGGWGVDGEEGGELMGGWVGGWVALLTTALCLWF